MKTLRLVFILVLLASVVLVPTKAANAFQAEPAGTINIVTYGVPTFAGGQLTYHFRVTYSAVPSATAPYDASVVVAFQHPQVIDSFTVTNASGQTVVTDATAGTVTIPHVTMTIGSSPYTLEFDVTFASIGSLPVGSLPLPSSASATISNTDPLVGSLPVMDDVSFTIGASAVSIMLTATPTIVGVGGTVTYTVTVSPADYSVLPVNARVAVRFAQSDLTAGVIGRLDAQSPVVVDNVNKVVTWEGQLGPAGSLPVTFTFTVKAGSLPGGVTNTYTAHATGTVTDVNIPGSLPTASDTEPFTIQAMKLFVPILYKTVP